MKITKEQLKQIIKEELEAVFEQSKTPTWSSDYTRTRDVRSAAAKGKSAHGRREDPFSSPLRYVKGKLGMPRDKMEKFRRDYNLTAGGSISDKALSFALHSSKRGDVFKKTMMAVKKDQRRVISALEDLSRDVDNGREKYLADLDRILAGRDR